MSADVSVVVIGGGIAGAAAAAHLAAAGREVTLLEQEAAPADKVCGEFINNEAQQPIARLGLDLRALGAEPIDTVGLTQGTRSIAHALPFTGVSLTRRVLDAALLEAAQGAGARIERGVRAKGIAAGPRPRVLTDRGEHAAGHVLLATGKHELHGQAREAGAVEDLIGFKTYFHLPARQRQALAGRVELFFFDGGYAGLQPVEGGRANLCLLVQRRRYVAEGGQWDALLAGLLAETPRLAALVGEAPYTLPKPLSIYRVPYGFVHRPGADDVLYRLGDQAAVTHSFTGDGIALALRSAALAAQAVLAGEPASAYHRQLAREVGAQVRRSMLLYRLACMPGAMSAVMRAGTAFPHLLARAAAWTRLPSDARQAA